MTATTSLDDAVLRRLRDSLRGEVIRPGETGYDEARRVWNARIDRRPGAIARCTGPDDVRAAVDVARENELLVAVRGGGHDYAGSSVCEGGLVIDLSPMNGVHVEPEQRTVRVQGGAKWNAVDRAAQAHGLATTGGTVSTVGVAGYTLGGGTGHLARRFGLGLDNVLSMEVVTADGQLLQASEEENPELFWALRGGGGNFGIVTAFDFRLHEVGPQVLAGQILHRLGDAREVLRFYRDFMPGAPDELQCYGFIIPIPPLDVFPQELHGQPALDLVAVYTGAVADGEEVLRPLRALGDPLLDGVAPQDYLDVQTTFDAGVPEGQRWYSRAHYLNAVSDGAIDTALAHTRELRAPFTMVYFEPLGGEIARVDREATAFSHRGAAYSFHILPGWTDPAQDDEHMAWARTFHRDMADHARGGVYVNLLSPDETDRVPEAYGASYERLARLKARYDPGNLFRMNHNIRPAA